MLWQFKATTYSASLEEYIIKYFDSILDRNAFETEIVPLINYSATQTL